MKRLKKKVVNNRGFSLVEVLCAIVLLTLVATPLLQVIFSSMSLNLKSKKTLAAADLTSDVMEYVSSLAAEDYSYTKEGDSTPTVIRGAKYYYWAENSGDYGLLPIHNTSNNTYYCYPGGPFGKFVSYTKNGDSYRVIELKDVDYNGYKYRVKIELRSDGLDANSYHCYQTVITVMDNQDPNYVYTTTDTSIPNKF